mmetsp:Transcript_19004/g.16836  ORF Transcript_19004/g.16836 Transcript_19004/m.16836 type:complete len:113 (+) Transcript_19004:122-460(+)
MSKLTGKFENKTFIVSGLIVTSLAQFLIGPSYFLPNSLWLFSTGQLIMGCFVTLVMIPSLPEMSEVACKIYPRRKTEASDVSSGAFNSMLGIGQMLGPFYGSYTTALLDFRI